MKIALLGYGKMGKLIEQLALDHGYEIGAALSRLQNVKDIHDADVCIDFSNASCVLDNVKLCCEAGKSLVIGTTGWEADFESVEALIEKASIGVIYASNFSLGINLFTHLVREAAVLFDPFKAYGVAGNEVHHKHKVDAPSGTAKALASVVVKNMARQKSLTFTSARCGEVPGTHSVSFSSPVDTITLTHEAHNRQGFAEGALIAAKWLQGKRGLYTIDDMMSDTLKGRYHV